MLSKKSKNKTRVKVTFYWPWTRFGAAIKSRATESGSQDNKRDVIKGKQAAPEVAGSRRATAWAKEGADTNNKASKVDGKRVDSEAKHSSSTDSKLKGFKSLFRRSAKREPVEYLQQGSGKEVWYKRRRISITQHMQRMREVIRKRLNQVTEFKSVGDQYDDDDEDDSLCQTSTFRTYPWWVKKWWNLYESGDPVVEKSAEELADMSALTERLRSLRLQNGLAEEWMQKEIDISDIISLEGSSSETSSAPENPWVVISSFFHDPSLAMTQCPYTSDEKDPLSGWKKILNEPDLILPGMSVQ